MFGPFTVKETVRWEFSSLTDPELKVGEPIPLVRINGFSKYRVWLSTRWFDSWSVIFRIRIINQVIFLMFFRSLTLLSLVLWIATRWLLSTSFRIRFMEVIPSELRDGGRITTGNIKFLQNQGLHSWFLFHLVLRSFLCDYHWIITILSLRVLVLERGWLY